MTKKSKIVLVTAVLLLPLVAGNAAWANKGKGKGKNSKGGNVKVELEAELQPPVGGALFDVEGEAEFKKKTNSNVDRQEFKAKVQMPVPTLDIIDLASAQAADLRLRLYRTGSGAPYAECVFKFDELETELEDGVAKTAAEFKLHLRYHSQPGGSPRLQEKAGGCDILNADPALPSTKGVPAVQENDTASVVLITETLVDSPAPPAPPTETELLSGLFQLD